MYKLLIADDEAIICGGLCHTINWGSIGVEVTATALDGEEALKLIREHHPQIAILDISMPFITGLELAEILAEEFPKMKTIILTAYKDFSYAQQAIKCRVFDYLTKPCHEEEVLRTVQRAIEEIRKEQDADVSLQIGSNGREENRQFEQGNKLTGQIKKYVSDHYREPDLSLKEVAKQFHISPSYLQHLLKKECDTNFSDLLNRARMEAAMEILQQGNKKIYEVAFEVGTNSSQYFSTKFKKYWGIEPRDVGKKPQKS